MCYPYVRCKSILLQLLGVGRGSAVCLCPAVSGAAGTTGVQIGHARLWVRARLQGARECLGLMPALWPTVASGCWGGPIPATGWARS